LLSTAEVLTNLFRRASQAGKRFKGLLLVGFELVLVPQDEASHIKVLFHVIEPNQLAALRDEKLSPTTQVC